MSGPYSDFQVRLYRDGTDTSWGFRLQGGVDFKTPLTVQRVFACSPAEGELQRGDVLLQIENNNAEQLLHKQAEDIIKSAGNSLLFKVRRGGVIRPKQATKQNYGFQNVADRRRTFCQTGGYGLLTSHSRVISSPYTATAPGTYLTQDPVKNTRLLSQVKSSLDWAVLSHKIKSPPESPEVYYERRASLPSLVTYQTPPQSQNSYEMCSRAPMSPGSKVPSFGVDYSKRTNFTDGGPPLANFASDYNKPRKRKTRRIVTPPILFGVDYTNYKPRDDARSSGYGSDRRTPPREASYTYAPVGEIKKKFHEPDSQYGDQLRRQSSGKRWQPADPHATGGPASPSFAWSPQKQPDTNYKAGPPHEQFQYRTTPPASRGPPATAPKPASQGPPKPQYAPSWAPPSKSAVRQAMEDEADGDWSGSLRPAGGVKPWELEAAKAQREQEELERLTQQRQATQTPSGGGHYSGRNVTINQSPGDSGAKVVHLQYNTPVGMYSKSSAQASLRGQTSGRPGEGTMTISGGGGPQADITQSSTYQMIHQEEDPNRRQAARYTEFGNDEVQYSGYQNQKRQSSSFKRLAEVTGTEDAGTSDF